MSIIGTTPNGVPIIACPSSGHLAAIEVSMTDAVSLVSSPFTGQTQAQQWPGADAWSGTLTLPPLTQDEADIWTSFLAELRGMANAFFLGDPMKRNPKGNAVGLPVVDMSVTGTNIAGTQTLYTRGWTANSFGLLLTGDYLQVGNRLHKVLDRINSDATGKAQIPIWPSLRELPTDGEAIILNNPKGLFRLASNKRTWSSSADLTTHISFQIQEFR